MIITLLSTNNTNLIINYIKQKLIELGANDVVISKATELLDDINGEVI